MEKPDKTTLEARHNDPANWHLGIFYYNKNDKRIFPPKRYALLGWTINFANPYSYLTFILMMVIIFAVVYFIFSR